MEITTDIPDEKPGLVKGKFVLLALLVTVLVCLVFWLAANAWVKRSLAIDEPPLDYAARATWPTPPVKHTTMEVPISNYVPSGPQEKWKTVELPLTPLEETLVAECAALAADEAFTGEAARQRLEAIAGQYGRLWYPRWLLGQWHALHGDDDAAAPHFTEAFHLAPAALMMPYVNPADHPVPDLEVGTIVLGFDRSDGEHLDQTLRLVYPRMSTDATGRLYLPVYRSVLRFAELPEPPGHHVRYRGDYQWFEFPGRVAQLRAAEVRRAR